MRKLVENVDWRVLPDNLDEAITKIEEVIKEVKMVKKVFSREIIP